uniref:ATRAB11C (ARABIDOPSIS RAB GTPASE 11C) n=1 Tax=Arundo donax TaxID=35708 RepID=A0A0A9EBE3_ARUDO
MQQALQRAKACSVSRPLHLMQQTLRRPSRPYSLRSTELSARSPCHQRSLDRGLVTSERDNPFKCQPQILAVSHRDAAHLRYSSGPSECQLFRCLRMLTLCKKE